LRQIGKYEIRLMDKKQFRQKMQKRLLEMSDLQRIEKSKKACRNLVSTPQFKDASRKVIMMFLSFEHEVDTHEAILSAWQLGKTVVLQKISWQQRHIIPVVINSLTTGFSTDVTGLRNPINGAPVPFDDIDLVVAPGLAFDSKGNRLGRGGSYYDRFFTNKDLRAPKCGFAFAEQLVEELPTSDQDVPIDFLVTDEKIEYFKNLQGE